MAALMLLFVPPIYICILINEDNRIYVWIYTLVKGCVNTVTFAQVLYCTACLSVSAMISPKENAQYYNET